MDGFQKFLDPEDVARPSGHSDIGFVKVIRPVLFGVNIQFNVKSTLKEMEFYHVKRTRILTKPIPEWPLGRVI